MLLQQPLCRGVLVCYAHRNCAPQMDPRCTSRLSIRPHHQADAAPRTAVICFDAKIEIYSEQ